MPDGKMKSALVHVRQDQTSAQAGKSYLSVKECKRPASSEWKN